MYLMCYQYLYTSPVSFRSSEPCGRGICFCDAGVVL